MGNEGIPIPPAQNGGEQQPAAVVQPTPNTGVNPALNIGAEDVTARNNAGKVQQHIVRPKINVKTADVNQTVSGQIENQPQVNTATQGYQGQQNFNPQWNVPKQPRTNSKFTIDFNLLSRADSVCQEFIRNDPLGRSLQLMASEMGITVTTDYMSDFGAFLIKFGDLDIYYIRGVERQNSPLYTIPQTQYSHHWNMGASGFTRACLAPWYDYVQTATDPRTGKVIQVNGTRETIVVFDDDVKFKLTPVLNTIMKIAAPKKCPVLTEDQYTSQQNNFNVIDTLQVQDKQLKDFAHEFMDANNPSAMYVPGNEFAIITVNPSYMPQFQQQFQPQFQQNFMGYQPGMMPGFAPNTFGQGFMNSFGSGFGQPMMGGGMFGMQMNNARPNIIAGIKFNVVDKKIQDNGMGMGGSFKEIHITEIAECGSLIVENFMKYFMSYFESRGLHVIIDLDISKVTPNVRKCLKQYCMPVMVQNQFMMYGGGGFLQPTTLTSLVSVNPTMNVNGNIRRMHPDSMTLKSFVKYCPDIAKDPKFPKSLARPEDRAAFNEFLTKAGFLQVLNIGEIHLQYSPHAAYQAMNELNVRRFAHNLNMTLDEYLAAQQKQQAQMAQQTQQTNQQGQGPQQQGQPVNQQYQPQFIPNQNFGFGVNQPMMGGFNQYGGFMGGNPWQQPNPYGGNWGSFSNPFGNGMFAQQAGFGGNPWQQPNPYGGMPGYGGFNGYAGGYTQPQYQQNAGVKPGQKPGQQPKPNNQTQGNPYAQQAAYNWNVGQAFNYQQQMSPFGSINGTYGMVGQQPMMGSGFPMTQQPYGNAYGGFNGYRGF